MEKRKTAMPRRAFAYGRKSKKKAKKGDSRRRQQRYAERLCKRREWELDRILPLWDEGIAAFRGQNRLVGTLKDFLERVRTGEIPAGSVLILESLDRLSREALKPARDLFESILQSGITICTARPEREYNPADLNDLSTMLEVQLILARAHEESLTKSYRCGKAWQRKKRLARRKKRIHGKKIPGWLKYSKRQCEVIPERVAIVKAIFAMASEGMGVFRIAKALNADPEKYPPWGRRGTWTMGYVRYLVTGRTALGEYQPKRKLASGKLENEGDAIPDYYPRIIDEATWLKANASMKRRAGISGRGSRGFQNAFAGLVYFAADGSKATLESRKGDKGVYRYLIAYRWAKVTPTAAKGLAFRYFDFETGLLSYLGEIRPESVLETAPNPGGVESDIARLHAEIVLADSKIAKLKEQVKDRKLGLEAMELRLSMIADLEADKARIAGELNALKLETSTNRMEALVGVQTLARLLATATEEEANKIRLRIRSRLMELFDAIWVAVQTVSRYKRVIHVQLCYRWGEIGRLVILPENPDGIEPWNLTETDLREGV